jgi:hypothetical protein
VKPTPLAPSDGAPFWRALLKAAGSGCLKVRLAVFECAGENAGAR